MDWDARVSGDHTEERIKDKITVSILRVNIRPSQIELIEKSLIKQLFIKMWWQSRARVGLFHPQPPGSKS